jgi:SagB-type dehydrogenase family enzyme
MIVENTDLFCYSLPVIEAFIINHYHTQGRNIMNTIAHLVVRLIVTVLLVCPSVTSAQELKTIKLSNPQTDIGRPLMQVLKDRKSSRAFSTEKVPLHVLSDLLWAAFGINRPDSGKRTAPSARNWQEIDIYVATADGLYLYEAKTHTLEPILAGDIRAMTGRQGFVRDVPVNLIYVADFSRMGNAPTDEKIFYSAADTGFISQNVYLYCASEGLATFVRALVDRPALAKAMRLRADQRVILAQSVGYPKR